MGSQPHPLKGSQPPSQFSVHVYCGRTAGWMKTPLGAGVDLYAGHIVLDGDPAPPRKGNITPPLFGPYISWPRSPISATAELLCNFKCTEESSVSAWHSSSSLSTCYAKRQRKTVIKHACCRMVSRDPPDISSRNSGRIQTLPDFIGLRQKCARYPLWKKFAQRKSKPKFTL